MWVISQPTSDGGLALAKGSSWQCGLASVRLSSTFCCLVNGYYLSKTGLQSTLAVTPKIERLKDKAALAVAIVAIILQYS